MKKNKCLAKRKIKQKGYRIKIFPQDSEISMLKKCDVDWWWFVWLDISLLVRMFLFIYSLFHNGAHLAIVISPRGRLLFMIAKSSMGCIFLDCWCTSRLMALEI